MGFFKKLSFKNITKNISKNISKIRSKKIKSPSSASAATSTEIDNECSDTDETGSVNTQEQGENDSITSIDASSIEDDLYTETFEVTINSNIISNQFFLSI